MNKIIKGIISFSLIIWLLSPFSVDARSKWSSGWSKSSSSSSYSSKSSSSSSSSSYNSKNTWWSSSYNKTNTSTNNKNIKDQENQTSNSYNKSTIINNNNDDNYRRSTSATTNNTISSSTSNISNSNPWENLWTFILWYGLWRYASSSFTEDTIKVDLQDLKIIHNEATSKEVKGNISGFSWRVNWVKIIWWEDVNTITAKTLNLYLWLWEDVRLSNKSISDSGTNLSIYVKIDWVDYKIVLYNELENNGIIKEKLTEEKSEERDYISNLVTIDSIKDNKFEIRAQDKTLTWALWLQYIYQKTQKTYKRKDNYVSRTETITTYKEVIWDVSWTPKVLEIPQNEISISTSNKYNSLIIKDKDGQLYEIKIVEPSYDYKKLFLKFLLFWPFIVLWSILWAILLQRKRIDG